MNLGNNVGRYSYLVPLTQNRAYPAKIATAFSMIQCRFKALLNFRYFSGIFYDKT